MKITKRSGPVQLTLAYTLGKAMGNVTGRASSDQNNGAVDTGNRGLEKAIQPQDATHVVASAWVLELPFGRGKRFGTNAKGVLNHIVGGWQLSGVHRYETGFVLSVSGGNSLPIFNSSTRPNRVPNVPIQISGCEAVNLGYSVHANINAFAANAPFTLGTASRTLPDYRGCGYFKEDLSLIKRFRIREGTTLQFRTESYNTLNRTKFADPALNINTPGTFGKITAIDRFWQPRTIQFALKLEW